MEDVEINADTGPPNSPIAESVGGHIESNPILRRTLSGGIRTTPVRNRNKKTEDNLVKGGHKKLDSIEKIGEFTTKYKATGKTKHLIKKHGSEVAEHLLKLSNSDVDGLNEKDNGFVIIYKVGDKTFIANEGNMGKKMVEDDTNHSNSGEASLKKTEKLGKISKWA